MSWLSRSRTGLLLLFIVFAIFLTFALAQDCSATKPCADGCCSQFGFCGWGDDFCGEGCLNSCQAQKGCDVDRPCESGCCSKFGFCGLGPDYCSKEVCVANCDVKAQCDPGGYGAEFVEKQTCPLNVCCSKYGFCGLTEEFCGSKKVPQPTCDTSSSEGLKRVVGYYESWSYSRPCNAFWPERIPTGVYTHLIFAFATIDPNTYEVVPSSMYDRARYESLNSLKKRDPDLKTFIAIGGWTFNDPGPTATVFSEIARSEANQQRFIKSLISFLSTYDFNGVDIDWEYPGADDRSGSADDFENFPKFLNNLKKGLAQTSGRNGLSITLPASYWYLQHFDIKALQKSVDFFNIMSYDLHGVWDKPNKWVGPYLNSHTNLTEIKDAMDLLWRNDIDSTKVNMGLAFYGRAFTATSPSCVSPGCTFESGANARPCSHEISVMMNSEILDVINSEAVTPILDKDAAVKILTFGGNQWVTYDDEETLKLKVDFARNLCLGGVMVWAVSHDTRDATFSQALGTITGRIFEAPTSQTTIHGVVTDTSLVQQCKWTNCGETCESGWKTMKRADFAAYTDIKMLYSGACDGGSNQQLCCPIISDALMPTCGWYGFNNGNCDSICPDGMIEVGSDSQHCTNGNNAVACCTANTPATQLYSQCTWDCDGCPNDRNDKLFEAYLGSSYSICHPVDINKSKKYCCNNDDTNAQWRNCQLYSDLGGSVPNTCSSNCPSGKIRVGMDLVAAGANGCFFGEPAWCCDAHLQHTVEKRESSQASEFRDTIALFWSEYGSLSRSDECTSDSSILARRTDLDYTRNLSISARILQNKVDDIESALFNLFFAEGIRALWMQQIWNDEIPSQYVSFTYDAAEGYFSRDPDNLIRYNRYTGVIRLMTCDWTRFFSVYTDQQEDCYCVRKDCCSPEDSDCISSDLSARALFLLDANATLPVIAAPSLSRRGGEEEYPWSYGGFSGVYLSIYYPSGGEWDSYENMYKNSVVWPTGGCTDVIPDIEDTSDDSSGLDSDHPVERQTLKMATPEMIAGLLPDGSINPAGAIPGDFFTVTMLQDLRRYRPNTPLGRGGFNEFAPARRIMNSLGSTTNRQVMVLAQKKLNIMKALHWERKDPIDRGKMKDWVNDLSDPKKALTQIRNTMASLNYLNLEFSHNRQVLILADMRQEWGFAADAHATRTGYKPPIEKAFDYWMAKHYAMMADTERAYALEYLDMLEEIWKNLNNNALQSSVLGDIAQLRTSAHSLNINTVGFFKYELP